MGNAITLNKTECLNYMGKCYGKLKNFKQSFYYHKKAYDLRLILFGKKSLEVADSLNNLGICNYLMCHYADAFNNFEKSFNLKNEFIKNKKSPSLADSLMNLAQASLKLGKNIKALEYFHKAYEIRKASSNEFDLSETINSLGLYFYTKKSYDKSLEYFK